MTAGVVMERMPSNERFTYIAGIVAGLAYARFQNDDKDETGLICISNWFYGAEDRAGEIEAAFEAFPDYTPAVIIWTLSNKECGE